MSTTDNTPVVPAEGMGATVIYPQDMYPMVVTRVSKSGKTAWIQRLRIVDTSTGHAPARHDGPFPIWDHVYTAQEIEDLAPMGPVEERRISLRKDGVWRQGEARVILGVARYYRNFSY